MTGSPSSTKISGNIAFIWSESVKKLTGSFRIVFALKSPAVWPLPWSKTRAKVGWHSINLAFLKFIWHLITPMVDDCLGL